MRKTNLAMLLLLLLGFAASTANAAPRRPVHLPLLSSGTTAGPTIAGCPAFPADNPLNAAISALPVHTRSAQYIASINAGGDPFLHADFGENPDYGIPFTIVAQNQPLVPVNFFDYPDESDAGPYPIPLTAPIEAGGDRHVLALQQGSCVLYELFNATPTPTGWQASNGARWDLRSNALRPARWTSADAAGLPIAPLLARYDEVAGGTIRHALRVTVRRTQRAYILPATHWASSSSDANLPPMGLRLRLKASYDISAVQGQARVILEALKQYGLIVADNGAPWFISGASDARWVDADLDALKRIPGSAFEAVETGPLVTP